MDTPPFLDWKRDLLMSAGTAAPAVSAMGDPVLECFFRDGCEPTLFALLGYAADGLHPTRQARKAAEAGETVPSP
jgi:hypothetical protein